MQVTDPVPHPPLLRAGWSPEKVYALPWHFWKEGLARGTAAGAKGILAGALAVGLLACRLGPERLCAARQVSAVAARAVDAVGEASDIRDVDGDLVDAVLVLKGVLDQGLVAEELAFGHAEVGAVAEGERRWAGQW